MAAKRRKALTRKVSRKRALSYDRMAPNARGVTALSEVNGEGAYERRYAQARRKLAKEGGSMTKAQFIAKQRRKGRSAAQAQNDWRIRSAGAKARSAKKRSSSRRSTKKKTSGARRYRSNLRRGPARAKQTKAEFIREQLDKGRTNAQAEATWRMLRKKQGYKTKKRKTRTYGKGKITALKARAGTRSKNTYLYRTKKGNTRKIPDWALLGYGSAAEMRKVYREGTDRQRAALSRKLQRLQDRRERAAKKAESKALRGTAWFSPNPGEILSFEEWKMKKNRARKTTKKKTTKAAFLRSQRAKGRSTAQAEAAWKLSRGAKKTAKKKTTKKSSTRRRKASSKKRTSSKKLPRYGTKAYYAAIGKKGAAAAKRKRRKSGSTSKKRTVSRRKKGTLKQRRARIRNLKKGCKTVRTMKANRRGSYAANRKRKSSSKRRSYAANRKRKSSSKRRSYKRNLSGAMFKTELKNAFKYGLIVTGGFVTHRVLSNLFDSYALSKVQALSTGAVGEYRRIISGAIVAAIGVPLAVRVLPKHAGVAAAGMAASLLYDVIVMALGKANQPKLLSAMSAYPNAPGYPQYSGVGSYYEFSPHQTYAGMGAYYETQPIPGLEQAAAGYGATGPMLTQAAAGLQQMYANPMGEYYATGLEGIGEYETVATQGAAGFGATDAGLHPNLHSAEQALDVAEAAAGVGGLGAAAPMLTQAAAGFGGVPLQSTVNPMIQAMNIPDEPGGSRAGILAGGDGIFG